MIIKIAWRNIWRNKVRSLVVVIAIALGLWAGTFASGFYKGMLDQKVQDVIQNEMSHLQFHHPKFRDELGLKFTFSNEAEIREVLDEDDMVVESSSRVIVSSMLASASKSGGIKLVGVRPGDEAMVTHLDEKLVEGDYFEGVKRNPIIISRRLAEDYKLKLKSKVVATVQDINGNIVASSFRVVGIYQSNNGMFDESNAFVIESDLRSVAHLGQDEWHEMAVLLKDHQVSEAYAEKYAAMYPELEVLPWLDLALGMRYMVEAAATFALIIVGIILIALLFSIVNTMLMAVMERTREIGMLQAIGMNRKKVFAMIMLETVFLTMVGAPIGLLTAYLVITHTGSAGLDLGAAAGESFNNMGFAAIVYPELDFATYLKISLMVVVMSLVAAVYPARKALKLNPSEAIRKI